MSTETGPGWLSHQGESYKTDEVDHKRRWFLIGATSVVGAVGAGFTAAPFISSMQPSAKAQAAGAPVEADISKLEPGQKINVEWRGKPVWIVRRTEEAIKDLEATTSGLRDPNSEVAEPACICAKYRALYQTGIPGAGRYLYPSRLFSYLRQERRTPSTRARLERRLLLPLSRLIFRYGRTCGRRGPRAHQPGGAAPQIHR